jgi:hypothetical protein
MLKASKIKPFLWFSDPTAQASVDLREGGSVSARMEAKDAKHVEKTA